MKMKSIRTENRFLDFDARKNFRVTINTVRKSHHRFSYGVYRYRTDPDWPRLAFFFIFFAVNQTGPNFLYPESLVMTITVVGVDSLSDSHF